MNFHDSTHWIYWILVVFVALGVNAQKQHKRQIYREQVLPALGGKIPEEAFRTDRLALNRLNKDGITVVDGALLEAREHDKNPDTVRSKPDIIQVYVRQDSRYVPPEGRYRNESPKSVDTTYVIRKPIGDHRDQSERTKQRAMYKLPITNDGPSCARSRTLTMENTKNPYVEASSRIKSSRDSPRGWGPPKAHGYANFYRFLPPASYNRLGNQQHYRTIYKPIVSPLVIPNGDTILTGTNGNYNDERFNRHSSVLDLSEGWNEFYQPTPRSIFLEENDGLFLDSHQLIANYEGFFNDFHGRYYRHVPSSTKGIRDDGNFSKYSKGVSAKKNIISTDGDNFSNVVNEKSKSHDFPSLSSYTDLGSMPETRFSCEGRTGTFADVETKCRVFHECAGWSKTSSLCPAGTAYSEMKKRCEWWNTVTCGF